MIDSPTKPREVELPVCPFPGCGQIGRQPALGHVQYSCSGPSSFDHRRTKMVNVRFREVVEDES